jgi:hypothetical protein
LLADLDALPILIDHRALLALRKKILHLGRLHNHSAYDAAYLELALHTNASLVTFDRKLAGAFRRGLAARFSATGHNQISRNPLSGPKDCSFQPSCAPYRSLLMPQH